MKYKLIKRMKKTTLILLVLLSCQLILAQRKAGSVTQECNPVTFTTQQDHQNMMDQLGIISVRPGPSGNESDPDHANYDESIATPYPDLPELLTLNNGRKVSSADMWWKQRGRP